MTKKKPSQFDLPRVVSVIGDDWVNAWKLEFRNPPEGALAVVACKNGFAIAFPHLPKGITPDQIRQMMAQAAEIFCTQHEIDQEQSQIVRAPN